MKNPPGLASVQLGLPVIPIPCYLQQQLTCFSTSLHLSLCAQIVPLRLAAKKLSREALTDSRTREEMYTPLDPVPPCPAAMWTAVAPFLRKAGTVTRGSTDVGRTELTAPCIERARRVRASLEQAIDLKPDLEASKSRIEELVSHGGEEAIEQVDTSLRRCRAPLHSPISGFNAPASSLGVRRSRCHIGHFSVWKLQKYCPLLYYQSNITIVNYLGVSSKYNSLCYHLTQGKGGWSEKQGPHCCHV